MRNYFLSTLGIKLVFPPYRNTKLRLRLRRPWRLWFSQSFTSDIAVRLAPPVKLSLEQAIDFINKDELVEVTPENIRLRKKLLTQAQRLRSISLSRRLLA